MAYTITVNCQGCQACVRHCPTQAITGERGEVHIIEAVRCIDCGTCGRVCPYGAVLTPEEVVATRVRRSNWLKPVVNERSCVSCGLCITACPVSCLDLTFPAGREATEGIPVLNDVTVCIGCSFCEVICPVGAIEMVSRAVVAEK